MGSTYSLTPKKSTSSEPVDIEKPQPSRWPIERRTLIYVALAVIGSLLLGMLGYSWICGMSLEDSYLNATFILSTMGPVGQMNTTAAKIFAGTYSIYCGIFFIAIIAFFFDRILAFHMK